MSISLCRATSRRFEGQHRPQGGLFALVPSPKSTLPGHTKLLTSGFIQTRALRIRNSGSCAHWGVVLKRAYFMDRSVHHRPINFHSRHSNNIRPHKTMSRYSQCLFHSFFLGSWGPGIHHFTSAWQSHISPDIQSRSSCCLRRYLTLVWLFTTLRPKCLEPISGTSTSCLMRTLPRRDIVYQLIISDSSVHVLGFGQRCIVFM